LRTYTDKSAIMDLVCFKIKLKKRWSLNVDGIPLAIQKRLPEYST